MAISKEEILDAIAQMPVMDLVELIKLIEEKFNVSAVNSVAVASISTGSTDAVVSEQTEFNVMLSSFGSNKISVIKAIRSITGLGLKEAKELVERAPSNVKEGISKEDAEDIKKQLEKAGASVEIK